MTDQQCKRICLWSGPRNVSTAVLYAFHQRGDTRAVDEPLYGHYLHHSQAPHPHAPELRAKLNNDGAAVIRDLVLGQVDRPILFLKMMAHHLPGLDPSFLDQTTGVILIRDPREVLATLSIQIPKATMADAGYDQQVRLLQRFPDMPVVDARELLLNPRAVLQELCRRIGIAFDPAMLSWPAGEKSCDGPWAPHWYHNVHQSTGFAPYRPSEKVLPKNLQPLLAQCQPLYQTLLERAIRAPATGDLSND